MIQNNGQIHRTLADPIFVDGKRVREVWANGVQVYPEVTSGRYIKFRGGLSHTFHRVDPSHTWSGFPDGGGGSERTIDWTVSVSFACTISLGESTTGNISWAASSMIPASTAGFVDINVMDFYGSGGAGGKGGYDTGEARNHGFYWGSLQREEAVLDDGNYFDYTYPDGLDMVKALTLNFTKGADDCYPTKTEMIFRVQFSAPELSFDEYLSWSSYGSPCTGFRYHIRPAGPVTAASAWNGRIFRLGWDASGRTTTADVPLGASFQNPSGSFGQLNINSAWMHYGKPAPEEKYSRWSDSYYVGSGMPCGWARGWGGYMNCMKLSLIDLPYTFDITDVYYFYPPAGSRPDTTADGTASVTGLIVPITEIMYLGEKEDAPDWALSLSEDDLLY